MIGEIMTVCHCCQWRHMSSHLWHICRMVRFMTENAGARQNPLLEPSVEEQRRAHDEFIGERVHAVMWRLKMSQTDLAAELGITQTALSHKLRGKRPFYARELGAVSVALGANPAYFYGLTDDPRPVLDEGRVTELSRLGESNPRPFHYE
ncbi:helix-turn-helix domain-containing protein [Nocardia otitidiscaviarum]|uniref:helix-turn-helix domain-containing protein n=1 Tax=Nocardia otitidiscaviarum TaxID=1823 RepID=UPI0039812CF3